LGGNNIAIGRKSLFGSSLGTSTGSNNLGIGSYSLGGNTTGTFNISLGINSLCGNTTGSNNIALGYGAQSGNFSNSLIIGKFACSTANNQFVIGGPGEYGIGTVTTETCCSIKTWSVIINGVAEKILLAC
jgi:hypothetical protein